MYDYIMVKYGDLILKGKNQHIFRRNINNQIAHKLYGLKININFQHDLVMIKVLDENPDEIIKRLNYISGLASYSKVISTPFDIEGIVETSRKIIEKEINKPTLFKVETKRANKNIPMTSLEISQIISKGILRNSSNLKVDVHNPEKTLYVEIRNESTYIYLDKVPGLGGFPTSIAGKAMVLLSGGIDSPVSAYLAMNTGLEIECIHFESTPLTPLESVQKVIDLTRKLSKYANGLKIKLHLVPFKNLHELLLTQVEEPYLITIMRRMMYRIADKVAYKQRIKVLVSGDSIGQVASQTIESMLTVQDAVNGLIIRPLATYDKKDIIKIATKIDTLEISNRPFSDCCTVYVPKSPIIKPSIQKCNLIESQLDYKDLLDTAVKETIMIEIKSRERISIIDQGFTVKEALGGNVNK